MTAVTFTLFEMNNQSDALTLEGVYERYGNFAGINRYNFVDDISGFVSPKWTTITNVSYSGGNLTITGGGVGAETVSWFSDDMPHSYVLNLFAHLDTWAIAVRGDGTNNFYKVLYNDSGYISIMKTVSGADEPIAKKELHGEEIVDNGLVQIAVRDEQFSSDSQGRIIYISVWLNGQLLISVSDNVQTNIPPLKMGVIVPVHSAAMIFSSLSVSNLGELIVWSNLSPGEFPMSAIQRAVEDRYIKAWIRWDGSLKAWRPKARTNALTLHENKEFSLVPTFDLKQIFTHIRLLGAFQWVQVSDPDLLRRFGHRFREINNTALWNADDCHREALKLLLRSKEAANQASMSTYGFVFLEIEDRIKIPDYKSVGDNVDFIIDSMTFESESETLRTELNLRQYFYGEP